LAETSSFPRGEGSLFVDPRVAIRFGKNDPGQTRIVPRRQGNFPVAPAIAARFGKADVDRTKRMPASMNDHSWLPTGHSSGDEHCRALAAPATS